jgi:hypothetical protein
MTNWEKELRALFYSDHQMADGLTATYTKEPKYEAVRKLLESERRKAVEEFLSYFEPEEYPYTAKTISNALSKMFPEEK